MTLREFYVKTNADYDAVIRRLMNETMVLKYLNKFQNDGYFTELQQSVCRQDYETAYRCAHTLKGLCLSLGLETMRKPVVELTEELRAGKTENAAAYIAVIEPLYADIIRWIGELSA
jgi:HPt (histidine-containing phosphotransfer) domain-containing protein